MKSPRLTSEALHELCCEIESYGYKIIRTHHKTVICDPSDNDQGYRVEGKADDFEDICIEAASHIGISV